MVSSPHLEHLPLTRFEVIGMAALHLGHEIANQATILSAIRFNLSRCLNQDAPANTLDDLQATAQVLGRLVERFERARNAIPSEEPPATAAQVAGWIARSASAAGWEVHVPPLPDARLLVSPSILVRSVVTLIARCPGAGRLDISSRANPRLPSTHHLSFHLAPAPPSESEPRPELIEVIADFLHHHGCRLQAVTDPYSLTLDAPIQSEKNP